jgi:hypothetical protein
MNTKRLLFHLLIPSSLIKLLFRLFIGSFRYPSNYSDCPHYPPFVHPNSIIEKSNFYVLDLIFLTSGQPDSPYSIF